MCNRKCLFSCRSLAADSSGSQSGSQSASPTALNVKNTEKTPGAFLRPRDIQSPTVTDRTCVCVREHACANRASLRGWRAWRPHTLRIAPPPTHTGLSSTLCPQSSETFKLRGKTKVITQPIVRPHSKCGFWWEKSTTVWCVKIRLLTKWRDWNVLPHGQSKAQLTRWGGLWPKWALSNDTRVE